MSNQAHSECKRWATSIKEVKEQEPAKNKIHRNWAAKKKSEPMAKEPRL